MSMRNGRCLPNGSSDRLPPTLILKIIIFKQTLLKFRISLTMHEVLKKKLWLNDFMITECTDGAFCIVWFDVKIYITL